MSRKLNSSEIQEIASKRKLTGETMKEVVTNAMLSKDYDSLKIFAEQNRGGTKGKLINS